MLSSHLIPPMGEVEGAAAQLGDWKSIFKFDKGQRWALATFLKNRDSIDKLVLKTRRFFFVKGTVQRQVTGVESGIN